MADAYPIVSSAGMEITDSSGRTFLDLSAAMASILGHRHRIVVDGIRESLDSHLGSPCAGPAASRLTESGAPFDEFADIEITASRSEANESAIRAARLIAGEPTADDSPTGESLEEAGPTGRRYRIVTVLGSDHGRTLACRSASGRVAAQRLTGPLAAGFRHAAPGDVAAMEKAVDATAAAVMLSPMDATRGGVPFAHEYLVAVRQICDSRSIPLIVDETLLPPMVSGRWFFHQHAGIAADIVTASAGWTGGQPGGLVLFGSAVTPTDEGSGDDACGSDYALLRGIITATARAAAEIASGEEFAETRRLWAQGWQELAEGFEFVREVDAVGLRAVVHCDLPAAEIVAAAHSTGLRWPASGETSLQAVLPITATRDDVRGVLDAVRNAFEIIERQPIES